MIYKYYIHKDPDIFGKKNIFVVFSRDWKELLRIEKNNFFKIPS